MCQSVMSWGRDEVGRKNHHHEKALNRLEEQETQKELVYKCTFHIQDSSAMDCLISNPTACWVSY